MRGIRSPLHLIMLLVAFGGFVLSLLAPGWGLALLFIALAGYLLATLRQPFSTNANSTAPPPVTRRKQPESYREIEWKGMVFRSNTEVRIAKTLDHRGIFFIPPTRVRLSSSKSERQSRELDFVICHEGKWGVLEVDGPFHDAKLDAQRDGWLRNHGIYSIQRFDATRCYEKPHAVVDEFLHVLEHSD